MTDGEDVRARLLEDHAQLRGKTAVLESLALQILRGDDELVSALLLKCADIQTHLLRHMGWEESWILPLLDELVGAGREVARIQLEEHDSQRRRVEELLSAPSDAPFAPDQLAKHILEFVLWLERDMVAEETRLLGVLGVGEEILPKTVEGQGR